MNWLKKWAYKFVVCNMLEAFFQKIFISQPPGKIFKFSFEHFFARVRAVCMQNFSILVLKLRVEFEVKDDRTKSLEHIYI